jgi:hypothetical protein
VKTYQVTSNSVRQPGMDQALHRLTLSLLMPYIYMEPLVKPGISYCIYLDEIFTGDFASLTVHFINICLKNQQIHQLFIQFINYVW